MVSRYVIAIAAAAAAGIIAAIVLYADIPYRMQDGKVITVTGRMVCLPHKMGIFGGVQTDECAFGFRSNTGEHYAISNLDQLEARDSLIDSVGQTGDEFYRISGVFTYGSTDQYSIYDIKGMVNVDSIEVIVT